MSESAGHFRELRSQLCIGIKTFPLLENSSEEINNTLGNGIDDYFAGSSDNMSDQNIEIIPEETLPYKYPLPNFLTNENFNLFFFDIFLVISLSEKTARRSALLLQNFDFSKEFHTKILQNM